ncbi:MAG: DUF2834 domain-containing protein [Kofleriaceae bacterium]|nr:DUF2834 domain-containing protein [Kofleriaceae bacterium]
MKHSAVATIVLLAFTAFSAWVIAGHGYTGFISLAAREPWGLQLLLDLVIACSFAIGWMRGDAKKRGITTTWPFVVATLFLGSPAILAYVIVRDRLVPRGA